MKRRVDSEQQAVNRQSFTMHVARCTLHDEQLPITDNRNKKMKLGFVFPGQASQYVGMGRDLWDRFPQVQDHYRRTNEILGRDIARLSFEGPEEKLNQTENTQPAVFALSAALWQLLRDGGIRPAVVAGHSLGEYAALVAAQAISYEQALPVVQLRGQLMQQAGQRRPGAMAAIIGLDKDQVEKLSTSASQAGLVRLANFNAPNQLVISGETSGVSKAVALAKEMGAKRVVPLPVSGAFHSPLMEYAQEELSGALEKVELSAPQVPVVANVTAELVANGRQIRRLLVDQLVSPVRWSESILRMVQMGTELFLEVGPGKVLQGLIRRIDPQVQVAGVESVETLQSILSRLSA